MKERKSKSLKKKKIPKLRKVENNYGYKLSDPQSKRKKAIDRSIRGEAKKTGRTIRKAAVSKKGRFNVLRIYRKNKKYDECMRLTKDMRYMDKKYKLGKTKNICNRNNRRKTRKTRKTRKNTRRNRGNRQIGGMLSVSDLVGFYSGPSPFVYSSIDFLQGTLSPIPICIKNMKNSPNTFTYKDYGFTHCDLEDPALSEEEGLSKSVTNIMNRMIETYVLASLHPEPPLHPESPLHPEPPLHPESPLHPEPPLHPESPLVVTQGAQVESFDNRKLICKYVLSKIYPDFIVGDGVEIDNLTCNKLLGAGLVRIGSDNADYPYEKGASETSKDIRYTIKNGTDTIGEVTVVLLHYKARTEGDYYGLLHRDWNKADKSLAQLTSGGNYVGFTNMWTNLSPEPVRSYNLVLTDKTLNDQLTYHGLESIVSANRDNSNSPHIKFNDNVRSLFKRMDTAATAVDLASSPPSKISVGTWLTNTNLNWATEYFDDQGYNGERFLHELSQDLQDEETGTYMMAEITVPAREVLKKHPDLWPEVDNLTEQLMLLAMPPQEPEPGSLFLYTYDILQQGHAYIFNSMLAHGSLNQVAHSKEVLKEWSNEGWDEGRGRRWTQQLMAKNAEADVAKNAEAMNPLEEVRAVRAAEDAQASASTAGSMKVAADSSAFLPIPSEAVSKAYPQHQQRYNSILRNSVEFRFLIYTDSSNLAKYLE
jgi:hypothetical protein